MSLSSSDVGQPIIDLKSYLRGIWLRRREVAVITIIVTVLGLAFTLNLTPRYASEARVVVQTVQDPLTTAPISPQVLQALMTTEAELVASERVIRAVRRSLPASAAEEATRLSKGLDVRTVPDSNILLVGYRSSDAERAAVVANTFAEAYLSTRTTELVRKIDAAIEPVSQRVESLRIRIAEIDRRLANKGGGGGGTGGDLAATRARLEAFIPTLQQRIIDLQTARSLVDPGQVVRRASVPGGPASPNVPVNLALSLVAGLVLGSLVALFQDATDSRFRSRDELERRTGAPVLAVVPHVDSWGSDEGRDLIGETGSRDPAVEAYGTLATNVRYGATDRPLKLITVTSSLPGEGKTVTAANLSIALAQAGHSVLVVSADLRRPRIQELFGADGGKGLTNLVEDPMSFPEVTVSDPGLPTLSLLPTGPLPTNPVAFLTRLRTVGLFERLRAQYDVVVVDSPPILPVADATILASMSDGVIFVHSPDRSSRQAVEETRDRLRVAGVNIVGVVYNDVDVRGRGRSYGAYTGTYSYQPGQPSKPSQAPRRSPLNRVAKGINRRIRGLRWSLRQRLTERPRLALRLGRKRYPESVVSGQTELLIDGFTRSAVTFAVIAFQVAQKRPVRVAHTLHSAGHILAAVRLGIPSLVTVRDPDDAVLSAMIREPHLTAKQAYVAYARFHERIWPARSGFVAARFEEATKDFGAVIERINARFGTSFEPFRHTRKNLAECFRIIDDRTRWPPWSEALGQLENGIIGIKEYRRIVEATPDYGAGTVPQMRVQRPSEQRDRVKSALRPLLQDEGVQKVRARARRAYEALLADEPYAGASGLSELSQAGRSE